MLYSRSTFHFSHQALQHCVGTDLPVSLNMCKFPARSIEQSSFCLIKMNCQDNELPNKIIVY